MEHDQLFCNLTTIVGSEEDVKARQRMFVIHDKVKNKLDNEVMAISTGSLTEGLDLPGSDVDIMFVIRYGLVMRDIKNDFSGIVLGKVFQMIEDEQFPGFVRLKVIHDDDVDEYISSIAFVRLKTGTFLSSHKFSNYYRQKFPGMKTKIHGPCVSDKYQDEDVAFCLKSLEWPRQADQWRIRHRKHEWPNDFLIDQITKEGCTIVPIGPRFDKNNDLHWRVSFALAEKQLVHSFNYTQILCYALLKITLKNFINRTREANEILCSYFLKTAVFWVSEEVPIETFQTTTLFRCYLLCIDKLISWTECCYCPNYIIPENNMFRGKIHEKNNAVLLDILNSIKLWEEVDLNVLLVPESQVSLLMYPISKLEFLFYRIGGQKPIRWTGNGEKMINFLATLMKLESSNFNVAICKYYLSLIWQQIVQCPKPEVLKYFGNNKMWYPILQRDIRYLLAGTKSDAVSGWLLYACYYYDQGAYNTTLKILDHVVSRFTPNMILIDSNSYELDEIEDYQLSTHINLR